MSLACGLALAAAPWLVPFDAAGAAVWSAWLSGGLIAAAALAALTGDEPAEVRELSLGLGLWAVFAPFVLKFTGDGAAASIHVLVGLAVTALAAFALMQSDGGQRPRWRTRAP